MTDLENRPSEWPETLATVLSCTYDIRAGRAMAFGLPSSKHFRIAYDYWAGDRLHAAEMYTEKAIPQGSLFPIRYDPEEPHRSQHAESPAAPPTKAPLLAFGIAGSIVLSTVWLLVLHGCQR